MLSDAELDRYARHIVLPQIGGAGQMRLRAAHVAVVGAGGIGCPALLYLAAAGVGRLTIIDDDAVSLSNLQRQVLFATDDVGAAKAPTAAATLARLNPHVALDARPVRLDADNAAALLYGADLILDGSDRFATRRIVNAAAVALRIPLLSAALGPFEAQVGLFRGWEPDQPCYACFVGDIDDAEVGNCGETGVLGAMAGFAGTAAATEAIRALHPFGTPLTGHLWLADMLNRRFRTIRVPKDPACPTCHA